MHIFLIKLLLKLLVTLNVFFPYHYVLICRPGKNPHSDPTACERIRT